MSCASRGVVGVCDEPHLLAALAAGGTVTFACSGTIPLTSEIAIAADTTRDGSGQAVIISGNYAVRVFSVGEGVTLTLNALTVANGRVGDYDTGGGPTWTMAPGPGSMAIDAGIDTICAATPVNSLDQRGTSRPQGSHCDIGAVEQQPYRSVWLPAARAR